MKFKATLINPVSITLLIVIILSVPTVFYSIMEGYYQKVDFIESIIINFHSSLIELIIIGIFILFITKRFERKENIKRWIEEIDDLRLLKTKESTNRIVGIIRRLNKEKISKIDLNYCYLTDAHLDSVNLEGANLQLADLTGANCSYANFRKADLTCANLTGTIFAFSDLRGINLITYEQIASAQTLYDAKVDCELEQHLSCINPNIFKFPAPQDQ